MSSDNQYIQQSPGLPCPKCSFLIQTDIMTLLSGRNIDCPFCGLKLSLDQEASEEGLRALRHLKNGLDKANQLRKEATEFGG